MQILLLRLCIAQCRFFCIKGNNTFLSGSIFWQCHVTMTPFWAYTQCKLPPQCQLICLIFPVIYYSHSQSVTQYYHNTTHLSLLNSTQFKSSQWSKLSPADQCSERMHLEKNFVQPRQDNNMSLLSSSLKINTHGWSESLSVQKFGSTKHFSLFRTLDVVAVQHYFTFKTQTFPSHKIHSKTTQQVFGFTGLSKTALE